MDVSAAAEQQRGAHVAPRLQSGELGRLPQLFQARADVASWIAGVEPKADFIVAGGTDFVRVDPEYDMGITGTMKIAHLAESFGLDAEVHACGPAHRHCMAAM